MTKVLLAVGMLGILIGAAMKTVAESDQHLHKRSDYIMVAGLAVLALAYVVGD